MDKFTDPLDQAALLEEKQRQSAIYAIRQEANKREIEPTGFCRLPSCGEALKNPNGLFCDWRCAEVYESNKTFDFE